MIVVDTNVIAYVLIPGTHSAKAQAALRKDSDWAAPLLWRSELLNVLALYVRQNQMPLNQAIRLFQASETLMKCREYRVSPTRVLELTAASNCTAYDCRIGKVSVPYSFPSLC